MPAPRALQILLAGGLTLGLAGFGLIVSGGSARALTYLRMGAPGDDGGLTPTAGASVEWRSVVVDGRPADVRVCRDVSRTPQAILERYAAIAAEEAAKTGRPFLREESAWGGSVAWIGADDRHRAVLAAAHPDGGTHYRLIVEERRAQTPRDAGRPLPGGLTFPGFEVAFSVGEGDGTGVVLLDARLSPQEALRRLEAQLNAAGYRVDAAARDAAPRDSADRATLPFRHGADEDLRALAVASPDADGARVSVAFRRD